MASRFYHSNVPRMGGDLFVQGLAQAFQQYRQGKRQQQEDARAAEDRQRATAMQDFTLAQNHVRLTKPGEVPHELSNIANTIDVAPGVQATQSDWAAIAQGRPQPLAAGTNPLLVRPRTSPALRVGNGWVQDMGAVEQDRRTAAQRALEQSVAEALTKVQIEETVNPGGRALARRKLEAEIQNLLTPKPVAPVMGSPEWREARTFEAQLSRSTHAANRAFDVANPVRSTEQGQAKPPSEGERRAAALLTVANNAYTTLSRVNAPNRLEAGAARLGMNEALSADRQKAEQAAKQFVSSYLYLVSGATASPQEVDNLVGQIVPQPGDTKETVQQKREAQATMLYAMQQVAGRAAKGTTGALSATSGGGRTVTVNGKTYTVPEE